MTAATLEFNALHRSAPSWITSVTLGGASPAVAWAPSLQPRQIDVSIKRAQFKISPRPRAVANMEGEVSAVAADQSRTAEAILRFAAQWKTSLLDRNAGRRAKDLSKTVQPVMQALLAFGPAAIDLRDLPVDRVNGMHLAVVLRATLTCRSQTPGWDQALSTAEAALRRDGLNTTSALSGLT